MNGQYNLGDTVLGNWTLKRLIGEGSFGKVYEAEREDFGRVYKSAIKIITIPKSQNEIKSERVGMSNDDVTAYFHGIVEDIVHEFELMSQLKGTANIVSYEDHVVLRHEDGIGWDIIIRMELLTSLLDYSFERQFTRQDVIKLGIDICRALELCQKYNIIHRDIKPENIFVSDLGDYKLGDFGIARTIEKTTSTLTRIGTNAYMAPEVCREGTGGFGVDIYSLGIVLYRFLNDYRSPFMPIYPAKVKYSDKDVANAKRISGAQMPVPRNADGRLAEIVLKACAYNPKDRYPSPMQMREELESISDENEVIIYPLGNEAPIKPDVPMQKEAKDNIDDATDAVRPAPSKEKSISATVEVRSAPTEQAKKKNKLMPLIAACVAALAVVALFIISPWKNDSNTPSNDVDNSDDVITSSQSQNTTLSSESLSGDESNSDTKNEQQPLDQQENPSDSNSSNGTQPMFDQTTTKTNGTPNSSTNTQNGQSTRNLAGQTTTKVNGTTTKTPQGQTTTTTAVSPSDGKIVSVVINTPPTKTTYFYGDTLDTKGLTLKVTYERGRTEIINSGFTCSALPVYQPPGVKPGLIKVSYAGFAESFSVTMKLHMVKSISIVNMPSKTVYLVGDSFAPSGIQVKVTFDSGETRTVSRSGGISVANDGLSFSPTTLSNSGNISITVTYSAANTMGQNLPIYGSTSTTIKVTVVKLGDVDGDGIVGFFDITKLISYVYDGVALAYPIAGDINKDGKIDDVDITLLQKLVYG